MRLVCGFDGRPWVVRHRGSGSGSPGSGGCRNFSRNDGNRAVPVAGCAYSLLAEGLPVAYPLRNPATWMRAAEALLILALCFAPPSLSARENNTAQYGAGLIVNLPFPESEVTQAVEDVVQNGIIRGSKEYNKDDYITGAKGLTASRAFPAWTDGGKVFYKVRTNALDPRNFKNGGDVGTLTVRYVVQAQGDANTVLRIDAVFVELFRKTAHPSNGTVESSEYKDIHDHLEAMELMKKQTAEAEKEKEQQLAKNRSVAAASAASAAATAQSSTGVREPLADAAPLGAGKGSPQTLEQHVQELRRQVERVVKAPGAPLKSAPFHTASTLGSLKQGTEILIVISTPYWCGVETHDGQHGWIPRDQLEQKP
jgi:hypothetical protein